MPHRLAHAGILTQAGTLTAVYSVMVVMFFGLDDGSQFLAGR